MENSAQVRIRAMTAQDIPAGLRLCRGSGWNQVKATGLCSWNRAQRVVALPRRTAKLWARLPLFVTKTDSVGSPWCWWIRENGERALAHDYFTKVWICCATRIAPAWMPRRRAGSSTGSTGSWMNIP